MKKFIKSFILVVCLVFPSLFCLTACDNAEHEHEFATEWSSDASNHYHACTGDDCEEVADKEAHTFGEWTTSTNATCTENGEKYRACLECGYKETQTIYTVAHNFATEWSSDASYHYHVCTGDGCKEVTDKESHTFGEFIIDETPTTQINGLGYRECSVCHEISRITISALKSTGLAFELNKDETSYTLTGIGTCTDTFINIPNTHNGLPVTAIKDYVFQDNKDITGIRISSNINKIGQSAFYGCTGLTSITIPNSVISIGSSVFYGCSGLTSITIPNNVTNIGNNTFTNCSSLSNITMPDSVTNIGEYAFSHCTNLTNLTIPKNVTNIGKYAFNSCSKLETMIFPHNITTIGDCVFANCSGLKRLIIPNSITSMGNIFDINPAIPDIFYGGTQAEWNDINKKSEIESTKLYFYSENIPQELGSNFWHYENGVPTEWINLTLEVNAKTGDNALTYGDTISYTASDVVATGLVSGETIESLGTLSFVYSTDENGTYTSTLPKNVGTYYVKVAGCVSNKYIITYTAGELEIKKARLTITVLDRTGDNALTYGDDAEYSTDFITVEGLKYDDTIANAGDFEFEYKSSLSSDYGSGVPKNAGTYSVISEITKSANYTSTYVEGTLEIKKATLTVTIPNIECTYGTIKGCETTITGFKYGEYRESDPEDTNPNRIIIEENAKLYNPVTGAEISTNGPSSYIDVGTYQYRPYYTAKNYDFEYVSGATYTIKPIEIKIKARIVLEVHCGDELNVEYQSIDDYYLGNDTVWTSSNYNDPETGAMITGTLSYTTNYTKGDPAGNYTIKAQGLTCGSSNYTIIWLETTFEVLA